MKTSIQKIEFWIANKDHVYNNKKDFVCIFNKLSKVLKSSFVEINPFNGNVSRSYVNILKIAFSFNSYLDMLQKK